MEQRFSPILRWNIAIVSLLILHVGKVASLTHDGKALMEFKYGLTVRSPLFDNWRPSDPSPCLWGGIICTKSGQVQTITLSAQVPMLEGTISASLGKLILLESLNLDQNLLSGSIPPELGYLSNLRTLSLYNNSLSGEIPPQLGNCSSLVELYLDANMLSGNIPESLGNLKNLGSVWLSHNLLTGEIPPSFAALPILYDFVLGNNSLTGSVPPVIYTNLNLQGFELSINQLTGDITTALEELSKLPAITSILMARNGFSGTLPPSIANATTLRYLDLSWNSDGGFGGQIPKELGKLVNLVGLGLDHNNFIGEIPPELGNMTSIQYLELGTNNLTGNIPSSLGNLVNLTLLEIGSNNITGQIPISLASLYNLVYIYLSYLGLTGPIPKNMSELTALEEFHAGENGLSGSIPEDFGRFMPNLTYFQIPSNSFSGTLPDGLCQGGNLQKFQVGNNQLEGKIPSSLAICPSLTNAGFAKNLFTSIPQGFGNNSSLEQFEAFNNQLTGSLPMGLGANSHLGLLEVSDNRLSGNISVLDFSKLSQNLSYLSLSKNSFIGEIPATVGLCKLLYWVDLSYNSFTGKVPPSVTNLSSLQTLLLQGNNLTRIDPSIYLDLGTSLITFNIAENPWNAPIPNEIGSLKSLQNLNMSYGGLTGSIPSQLGMLEQLEALDLSHNNLTGEVPSGLGEEMKSLVFVDLSFNRLTGPLPPAWLKLLKKYPDSFIGNPGLCLDYDANNVCVSKSLARKDKHFSFVRVVVAVALGSALALIILIAFILWWRRPAKFGKNQAPLENIIVKNLTHVPLPVTFEEVMAATENLSDAYIIGRGGHGVVYKVELPSSTPIVVKKIESLDTTTALIHKSFWSEIETMGKAKHRNLVRLLGFMKWGEVGLLLYEYISNGDLHSVLYENEQDGDVDLTWKARLRIAEGVAHGLAYIHHDYDPPIVHRDIKSSNVLLDDNLEAHISDFGLAKVLDSTQPGAQQWPSTANVSGTYGYIAPEVGTGTAVTPKLDVYSYGVLLLELLTGRQPADASYGETWHVADWVQANVLQNEGRMSEYVLDPSLLDPPDTAAKDEMLSVQRIALLCTRKSPADRPTMRDVANLLKSLSERVENRNENGNYERGESSTCEPNEDPILPIQV